MKTGDEVTRKTAPGLLTRCFGKATGVDPEDTGGSVVPNDYFKDKESCAHDATSLSSHNDCNQDIEVLEVEVRRSLRPTTTESAL